jgi:hypothetical protein
MFALKYWSFKMAVIDLQIISIVDIIGDDKLHELIKTHGGCRIYLPKKDFEYKQQQIAYAHAVSIGYSHEDALIYVAQQFNRSVRTIGSHFNMGMFE